VSVELRGARGAGARARGCAAAGSAKDGPRLRGCRRFAGPRLQALRRAAAARLQDLRISTAARRLLALRRVANARLQALRRVPAAGAAQAQGGCGQGSGFDWPGLNLLSAVNRARARTGSACACAGRACAGHGLLLGRRAPTWAQAFYLLPCTFLPVSALCLFSLRDCVLCACLSCACLYVAQGTGTTCRYPHRIRGYATGGHPCNCRFARYIAGTVPFLIHR
jgi:hypothetical protein